MNYPDGDFFFVVYLSTHYTLYLVFVSSERSARNYNWKYNLA